MLLFEAIDAPNRRPAATRATRPPLPLYVEPAPEEALLSWLLRLATRLGVSLHTLAAQSFGIDDPRGHSRWWCRPHPWALARMSERTGVGVSRLRQMTFAGFEPAYRDDEAGARFAGRRYETAAFESRAYRFAVCGSCLERDTKPYLRTAWLIGWMAVCPQHGTILIERCKACGARLRTAPFTAVTPFSPTMCTRCGVNLLDGRYCPAHPAVVRMQSAFFQGKCDGATEIEGLGRLALKEIIALADVLLGMVWTDLTMAEQEEIFLSYTTDPSTRPRADDAIYDCRHGSLLFLAWLIAGWPTSPGATVGRRLLVQWLSADRNRLCRHIRSPRANPWTAGPHNFEPAIRRRLQALADAS